MTKESFLRGAAILGIAGIVVKILGAVYRIPLANIIGDEGLGYYQTAYPIYNLLFSISTAGLPVAIAKLVSEKRALGDYRGGQRVFRISFAGLFIGGVLTSLFIFLNAKYISNKIENPNAYYSMIALAPALFFVPIMSAFRGLFQGRQNMVPTAVSQVVEQLLRISVGLFLAYTLLDMGLPIAAGGASFGASAGAIFGTITMIIIYLREKKDIKMEINRSSVYDKESTSKIIKDILAIAVPISIGACVVPLLNMVDVTIVMKRLQSIGYSQIEANNQWGQLTGMAQTLINFPQVFSIALSMSLVPAVSDAYTRKNYESIRRITRSGVRITLLIGLPSAMGLFALAIPIISLLYGRNPVEVQLSAGAILQVLSFSVIFLTLVQCLTAILQGLGKPIIPVRNLFIGAIIKSGLSYTLVVIPGIEIRGAAISTIVAYLIATVLNFIEVKKYTKTEFKFGKLLIGPVLSVVAMTLGVWLAYEGIAPIIGGKLSTVVAILIGILIYGFSLLATGSINSDDFELLPKGNRIARMLKALKLLKD